MKFNPARLGTSGLLLASLFVPAPLQAETSNPNLPLEYSQAPAGAVLPEDDASVAPERGAIYARLRHFEGGISVKREDESNSEAIAIAANAPLIPGDQIWTGEDGRVEIQLADGTLLRLDRNSRLSLLSLADHEAAFDNTTLVRLLNGSLYVRADSFDPRQRRFQLDTPASQVFLLSGGIFRIDVGLDGVTTLASFRGVAEMVAEDSSVMAHSGERITVERGFKPAEARAFNTLRRDPFDAWVEGREDAYAGNDADRGVRPELPAPVTPYASELSRYGEWRYDDGYGWIWVPGSTAPDWRPYYYGHWTSTPVGWTWVSYEPWGWAPYHYGRWHWGVSAGWFWIPGFVYSGAYVSWAIGPSYYGWCPTGYWGDPVFYNHHYPWVYVSHDHVYDHHVHQQAYSWRDVARYRLDENAVQLKSQPRTGRGYRPEVAGRNGYSLAVKDRSLARTAPTPSAAQPTVKGRTFRDDEQAAYRRILARQAATERRNGLVRSTGSTAMSARPGGSGVKLSPGPGSAGGGGARIQPISNSPGARRISPATGRPLQPPVRVAPRPRGNTQTTLAPRTGPTSGHQETGSSEPTSRAPIVRRGYPAGSSASAPSQPGAGKPQGTSRAASHPRFEPGRNGTRGSFVMPARPASPAPKSASAPSPSKPQRPAQVSKSGGGSGGGKGDGKKGGKN